jgi:hypothetical protein
MAGEVPSGEHQWVISGRRQAATGGAERLIGERMLAKVDRLGDSPDAPQ